MSDIVERLRETYWRAASETNDEAKVRRQRERDEAASEIERLRMALRQVAAYKADDGEMDWADAVLTMNAIARAALEGK